MKVAFCYAPQGVRVPIDIANIWTSSRGLTGSELAFFKFAEGIAKIGHEVHIFTKVTADGMVGGAKAHGYGLWTSGSGQWDAVVASTCADPLERAPVGAFRFLHHQCNGFSASKPGWQRYTDVVAPLSHTHARFNEPGSDFSRDRWRVLHNGVDWTERLRVGAPSGAGAKDPHRVIWASSLDRGLHRVLEAWPAVVRNVPDAELHVFYDTYSIQNAATEFQAWRTDLPADLRELGIRSRYILASLERLRGRGVYLHGSVSQERLAKEMARASVLAYPLEPIYFTETFGVTVLEAMAAGTVPVLCADDAFGELWGDVAVTVPAPYRDHKRAWTRQLIDILTNDERREWVSGRCQRHAGQFDWRGLSVELEACLRTRGAEGLQAVRWS